MNGATHAIIITQTGAKCYKNKKEQRSIGAEGVDRAAESVQQFQLGGGEENNIRKKIEKRGERVSDDRWSPGRAFQRLELYEWSSRRNNASTSDNNAILYTELWLVCNGCKQHKEFEEETCIHIRVEFVKKMEDTHCVDNANFERNSHN